MLNEGQRLADYRVERRLASDVALNKESWLATNEKTGDRVCLRVWSATDVDDWPGVVSAINKFRGLVHGNINLSTAGQAAEFCYLAEPFLASANPIEFSGDQTWKQLADALDAIHYSHRLGLVHGHLHPGNLLVDGNGDIHICGFGTPANLTRNVEGYQSRQVRQGQSAAFDDDVYSLGCLLFRLLGGKEWSPDVRPDQPIPAQLQSHLDSMLSSSPLERQVNLSDVAEALREHYSPSNTGIESVRFNRPASHQAASPSPGEPVAAIRTKQGISTPLVIGGMVAVVVLAAVLFTLLPQMRGESSTTAASGQATATTPSAASTSAATSGSTTPAAPQQTPIEIARQEHLREKGSEVAGEIFRLQVDLEDQGVSLWAPEETASLNDQLVLAESAFRESRFDDALTNYQTVRDGLQALIDQIPDELAAQLTAGAAALENGDAEAALTAYTIANALSPEDADIDAGLQRAENLDQVIRLVRQAEAFERDEQWQDALATFEEARDLDGLWQPAVDGVARARSAIREQQFRAAMSTGFQGISDKQYTLARGAFQQAASIKPESTEPAEGLLQLEQSERNDIINDYRQRAERHMAAEAWQDAIDTYQAALNITETLAFAREGLAEAENKLAITEALTGFLSDPTQLQADETLSSARSLLREAARADFQTSETQQQINTLAQLISMARLEVPVTILSDGKTNVVVRKHAQLGQIQSQVVYLYPGRYVITGDRPGYRDVREELVILAGDPAPTITVASDERVR